jgi:hypothetical protein
MLWSISVLRPRIMFRLGSRLLCAALGFTLLTTVPIAFGAFAPAQAQTRVSAEFHRALEPYGRWERHARWGDVWIPADRRRGWRPYTVGHWVYTNDWGWYWAEDQAEAAWGWATYHYGRWVLDPESGWVWLPGDEWGPAFVDWRGCRNRDVILWPPRRDCLIGWAPLPPDEIVAEFVEEPAFWTFVRLGDFATTPRMSAVILPLGESSAFLRETVLINRTVPVREHGHFAVNPGIPAGVVAAAIGRPLHTFDVHPRVLAGTANIPGATMINPQDLRNAGRNRNAILQPRVQQTSNVIVPATRAPQIKPLAAGERGRLGANPPRAATGALQQPRQQGQTQQQQPRQQGQGQAPPQLQPQQQGRQQPSRPTTEGQRVTPQQPPNRPQTPAAREAPQTQGRATEERRPPPNIERPNARPAQQPQSDGRREIAPQRQQPQSERSRVEVPRGRVEEPRARPQPQRTMPSATEGRGGGAPPRIAPPAAPPHAAPAAPPAAPHAAPAPAAPPAHAAPAGPPAGGGPHRP